MSDATQESVSAAAEKAQKQNNAVVATEVEAGASVSTGEPGGEIKPLEPEVIEDDPKEKVLNPRDAKIAAMAASRAEKQKDQGTQPKVNEVNEADDGQGGKIKLNVKGTEKEVSAEKVMDAGIRTLQKESTADQKLEEAGVKEKAVNTRMDELDAREQNIAKREQELKAGDIGKPGKKAPSASADVSDPDLDEQAEKLTADLYSGNKKKAEGAMKAILERTDTATPGQTQTVTAEDVATVVEKRAGAKQSLQRFNTTFPEINADVNLQNIVNAESLRIRREHPEYSQDKLLMESGMYVAKKYGSKIVDDTGFQDKAARKALTDTVSGADVTRRPKAAKPPPTRKQVVADMKAGRR